MFSYQQDKTAPVVPCTRELFTQTLDDLLIAERCRRIAEIIDSPTLDGRDYYQQTEEERHARKDQAKTLKDSLPSFLFNATFKGTRRLKDEAVPSGLVMMDVDGMMQDPRQWYEAQHFTQERLRHLGISYIHLSPSGHGLHFVGRCAEGWSIEKHQAWLAAQLGLKHDEGCKDLTRCSYAVPRSYTLYLDEERLFGESNATPSPLRGTPSCEGGESRKPSTPRDENVEQSAFPSSFLGIPYVDIIRKYWEMYHDGAEPVMGNRNTLIFELACQLRYITDFNHDWLMQVIPSYQGFSEQEKSEVIKNALSEKVHKMPARLTTVLSLLKAEGKAASEESGQESLPKKESETQHFEQRLPRLPVCLADSLEGIPQTNKMPALCAILPLAGAYATDVTYRYCDGDWHRLNLMSIIVGRQASGKSVAKNVLKLWKRPMQEDDRLARDIEAKYMRRRRNRKVNEKAPDDPEVVIREVPVTISCSALLKRHKYAKGKHLYSFGEELDTLRKTNSGGSWSNKYDLYREGFDNGEWGQDYNSDQAESGIVEVAYNWTMLGTYGALKRIFRREDVENGLCGRILYAQMPDTRFSKMPHYSELSAQAEEHIRNAVRYLQTYSGRIEVPRLRKAIADWCEQQRLRADKDLDEVRDNFRKRAAVIGMRCGVLFHLMEMAEGKPDKESKACVNFGVLMAEYALCQQCELFGEDFMAQMSIMPDGGYRSENKNVFEKLPPTFSYQDLLQQKGQSAGYSALRSAISRWKTAGWIVPLGDDRWKKLV